MYQALFIASLVPPDDALSSRRNSCLLVYREEMMVREIGRGTLRACAETVILTHSGTGLWSSVVVKLTALCRLCTYPFHVETQFAINLKEIVVIAFVVSLYIDNQ